jgi:hypothetical protein
MHPHAVHYSNSLNRSSGSLFLAIYTSAVTWSDNFSFFAGGVEVGEDAGSLRFLLAVEGAEACAGVLAADG